METFEFAVVASGLNADDRVEDRFFEAGCDDATISWQKGAIILEFARDAETFGTAVETAIDDVRRAGARVERVEPDHLVSLSEIALRADLTRAAISHYASGERGSAFPAPISRVTTQSPLWDWAVVADWLHVNGKVGQESVARARAIRSVNEAISRRIEGDRAA